jgi:N-methylhydantoinase A
VSARYRIGVDIGGTFTDFVMIDAGTGRVFKEKLLTTPKDPSLAVLDGIGRMLEAHRVRPEEVLHVIHGTTLVANAIIERKGVKTALVTTRGFRDVLEIGLEWRYDTYDLAMELPPPLVPRELRFEVGERVGPDGSIIEALDESGFEGLANAVRDSGAAAVGISLLNSFLNPAHEQRVRDVLAARLPGTVICVSSDVVPEIGEYERTSTTVANAYVLPLFDRYLRGLRGGLDRIGIRKDLYLVLSDGGTVHESTAIRHPIRLVQSGPAGGVQATTIYGRDAEAENVFCFDMGGTTAKACLIDQGEPARSTEFEVARVARMKKGSGLPLRIPVIEMIEIGAGGGSISRVDRLGLIQVGPDSASADPGPACYGRGGEMPTVTDADLVLGYLDARSFLGGDMPLDLAAARAAIERGVAKPLGISIEEAAWAIHDTVNENMARAASIHALEKARRISDYAMVPIGGAGPVHAGHIALKLGLPRVIMPVGAGVASAFGFLAAPTAFSFVRGRVDALEAMDTSAVVRILDELEAEGRRLLAVAGTASEIGISVQAAMRYAGQGYEVDVTLDRAWILAGDRPRVRAAFEAEYRRLFGRIEPAMAVEIVSWRLTASGPRPHLDLKSANAGFSRATGSSFTGGRPVFDAVRGEFVDTPVHDRYAIQPGQEFDGPLVIEERESTVVVPRSARVRCNDSYNLLIDLPRSE